MSWGAADRAGLDWIAVSTGTARSVKDVFVEEGEEITLSNARTSICFKCKAEV